MENFIANCRGAFGTSVGALMAGAFTGGICLLVLGLAADDIPALEKAKERLLCVVGWAEDGSKCVQDKLAELDAQLQALEDDRQRLAKTIAAQDFVFSQGAAINGGVSLVTGTLYVDASRQSGLIRSFCWAIKDMGGLDPRVGLAVMESDGRLEFLPIGPAELDLLDVSMPDVQAARGACPFPDVR